MNFPRKDAAMNPDLPDSIDDPADYRRWTIPLFEEPRLEIVPVTEDDFPLRLESMPEEGFHPQLHFYRDAG